MTDRYEQFDVGDSPRIEISIPAGNVRLVPSEPGVITVSAASGDVDVHVVRGRAQVRTAAGDVNVRRLDGSHFEGKSLSGDVRIGIPAGRTVDVDVQTMSGDVRNELPAGSGSGAFGDRCTVRVKSLSGDVVFRPAS